LDICLASCRYVALFSADNMANIPLQTI